ncbi:MAG: hypothetical protein DMG92_11835, partial [Acidobacteria bacterium]
MPPIPIALGLKLGWTEFCPMANIETSGNLQLRPFAKSSDRRLKIMVCRLNSQIIAAIGALLFMCSGSVAAAHPAEKAKPAVSAVLWTDPGDIRSLNLFWGPGGEKHQPQQPVEFLEEDMNGTSPKFDVR